jgi:hypothetical protein
MTEVYFYGSAIGGAVCFIAGMFFGFFMGYSRK